LLLRVDPCAPGARSFGWQINPVFHVYQHQDARFVLDALVPFFGCGRIRSKGPGSSVLTYAVDRMRDLEVAVIPFFKSHPLVVKQADFRRFVDIVDGLRNKEHFTPQGFERAIRNAYGMNANGKQRKRSLETVLAGSSETARQAPLLVSG
jgi:LAGLIDADG endonuclease